LLLIRLNAISGSNSASIDQLGIIFDSSSKTAAS
jgi:hypothetical protein